MHPRVETHLVRPDHPRGSAQMVFQWPFSSIVGQTGRPTPTASCVGRINCPGTRGGHVARSRGRDLVRRSIGAVIVTGLLGAAVAVGAGLPLPGSVAAPVAEAPAVPGRTISPVPT